MRRVAITFFQLRVVKKISCKNFNSKSRRDTKILLDCNSFKYIENRLSNARLIKNIVKNM